MGHVPAFQNYSDKYYIDWTVDFTAPNLMDIPFPDYWFPAEISRKAEVKNLAKGASIRHPQLDSDFIRAAEWFQREAHARGIPHKFALQTINEVKAGITKTSGPGYYAKRCGFTCKGEFIECPLFVLAYEGQLVDDYIFEVCPKVELRDQPRVEAGKTRTFMIAGIEHEILARKYCGNMMEWFNANFKDIFALGNDLFHGGWHRMLAPHLKFNKSIDDDGPAYDLRIPAEAFWLFWHYVLKKWCPVDDKFEDLFQKTIVKLVVDGFGNLFVQIGCNPSGWLLTAFFNCWWNYILSATAWLKTTAPIDYELSYHEFIANVEKLFMGDDRLLSVSDHFYPYFNMYNIHTVMQPWMPYEPLHDEEVPPDKAYFLSKRSVWDEKYHKLVPTIITSRSVCSAVFDHSNLHFFGKLMKLLDLRIYAFYTPSVYKWLDDICRKQILHCKEHFAGTHEGKVAMHRYWNEDQIRAFYCEPAPDIVSLRDEPDWEHFVSTNSHTPGPINNIAGVLEPNLTRVAYVKQATVSRPPKKGETPGTGKRAALEAVPRHSQVKTAKR